MGILDFIFKLLVSNEQNTSNNTTSNNNLINRSIRVNEVDSLRNKLEEVFASEFGGFDVRKDVNIAEIMPADENVSYSYGLYNGAMPKILIMVLKERNDYKRKKYKVAKEIAEDKGIVYLNFYAHLPNEVEYIKQRIRQYI